MLNVPDRWRMLAVLFLARTGLAFQFQTVASDGPFLIERLGIGYGELGALIGLYMLPGIVIAIPGGMLGQRFGVKRLVIAGLVLMAAGGVLTTIQSVPVLFAGRLISGLGAVFVNVLMTKMIADWFAGREIVTAMSTFVTSWPAGIALGLISFPPLAAAYSWPAVMALAAVVAAICFVLVAVVYRDPADLPQESGRLGVDLSGREWLLVSLAGFIWGTFNAGYVILISFLPELFAQRGYSLPEASSLVSLLAWALIPSIPVVGYIAEQVGRPNLLLAAGLLLVGAAAAVLPLVGTPVVPFAVIVAMIALPPGLIMAPASEAVQPENRSTGMGVFYTWHYAAMGGLPAVAGVARALSGSPAAPSLFAALLVILGALALLVFRLIQREAPATTRSTRSPASP